MKFKNVLLATDLDNTLLNKTGELSPENKDAINYFISEGGLFTVATGRSPIAFRHMLEYIPINAPVLLSNGGILYDYNAENLLYADYMTDKAKNDTQIIFNQFPTIGIEIHMLNKKFCINRNRMIDAHMGRVKCSARDINELSEAKDDWLKIVFCDETERLLPLSEWAQERFGESYSLYYSCPGLYEMQNPTVNKGTGLIKLISLLGLSKENAYCAGDNENDLSMLNAVESFAPENAVSKAKSAVKHIMPDCNQHTIAAIIGFLDKRYTLCPSEKRRC